MNSKNIIVVGASTGGLEARKELVSGLPEQMPASVFVVWHMLAVPLGYEPPH